MGAQHYSGLLTRLLLEHVEQVGGAAAVEAVVADAGDPRPVAELLDDRSWSSYAQLRALLEAAARHLGGPAALIEAGHLSRLDGGSMPSATDALQALGSIEALLVELSRGNMGYSTIELGGFTEQIGATTWNLTRRLPDGFEPFEELCCLQLAMVSIIPRLFGFTDVDVTEVTCQRHGDRWCTMRLHWAVADEAVHRANFAETRLALLERRLATFESTMVQIAANDDLDELLDDICRAAASTVRAPAFVLALEPLPWTAVRPVHAVGLDDDAARKLAEDLGRGARSEDVVVDITSSRRHHGVLAAVDGAAFLPPSQVKVLQSYAGLVATALDSAVALEEARQRADTADALLELATRIARVDTLPDLAGTLAGAVRDVIGSDRSVVALVDEDRNVARPIAGAGYTPEQERALLATSVPLAGRLDPEVVHLAGDGYRKVRGELGDATGSEACVMVPVAVDGRVVAWLSGDVSDRPERLTPTPDLERRLRGLASFAATAMHNSLLLDRVSHQANHDPLTDLPNRALLVRWLEEAADESDVALLFVDLDDFKDVNDRFGHHAGDELLCAVAGRLRRATRERDRVARLGGDEFAVLVEGDAAVARHVGERVLEAFATPFRVADTVVQVSASVGVATSSGRPPGQLLHDADLAMYAAKAGGKARLHVAPPSAD